MTWRIKVSAKAVKALGRMDKPVAERIYKELKRIEQLEDPRSCGKALKGTLSGLWRYRIGDYRVICDIKDGVMVVLVIDVSHRSQVYKRI